MFRSLIPSWGRVLALFLLLAQPAFAASLAISPLSAQVPVLASRAFTVTASGLASNQVNWFVNGVPGGNAVLGSIDATGNYTAPDNAGLTVTITAVSVADPTVSAMAQASVRNRVPWLYGTSPAWLPLGAFTLDIIGDRFVSGAKAYLNGKAVPTTFVNAQTLRISGSVAAGQIGSQTLVVENPGPVASAPYLKLAVMNTAPVPALQPAPPADPITVAASRFLEEASFGATPADVAFVKANGMQAWLDRQFDPQATPPSVLPGNLSVGQTQAQVFLNMAHGQDQLRQRMIFALSQILVISAEKNTNANELTLWIGLLSKHAFGNYRDLLHDLTLDAGMGKFLDLANSQKPAANNQSGANENYARELMQLFSIGLVKLNQDGTTQLDGNDQPIPTYSQNDIRQVALALTGWTYPTPAGRVPGYPNGGYTPGTMEALPYYHDMTAKTLPGGTVLPANNGVNADLNGVLDDLFNHPNLPPFLATRLIRSLVTSNPTTDYIRRVADVFAGYAAAPGYPLAARGDLKATLAAVLLDPEARNDAADPEQGRLKDPVPHLIGLARHLGARFTDPNMFMYLLGYLGEKPLDAPSVFSFYSPLTPLPGQSGLFGPEFQIYSPSQAILRANLIYSLLQDVNATAIQVDLTPFSSVAVDPNALLNLIDARLFMGRMSPELRQALYKVAVAHTDLKQRALITVYLAAISGEYLVER